MHETPHLRGFAKNARQCQYVVTIQVNGRQLYVASAKSREEAARAYDAALWVLAPYTPSRARPNYPEDFANLDADTCYKLLPGVNAIRARAMNDAHAAGVDITEADSRRRAELAGGPRCADLARNRAFPRVHARKVSELFFQLQTRLITLKTQFNQGVADCGLQPDVERAKLINDARDIGIPMLEAVLAQMREETWNKYKALNEPQPEKS